MMGQVKHFIFSSARGYRDVCITFLFDAICVSVSQLKEEQLNKQDACINIETLRFLMNVYIFNRLSGQDESANVNSPCVKPLNMNLMASFSHTSFGYPCTISSVRPRGLKH